VSTVLHPNKMTSVAWAAPVHEEDVAVCSSVLGMESDVRLRLATGCIDCHTRVWRWPEAEAGTADAECEAALGGGKAIVAGVAWSQDGGAFLAAGWGAGEDALVVWAAPPTQSPSQLIKLDDGSPLPSCTEGEAEPDRLPITIPTLSLEDVGVAELGFNELRCVPTLLPPSRLPLMCAHAVYCTLLPVACAHRRLSAVGTRSVAAVVIPFLEGIRPLRWSERQHRTYDACCAAPSPSLSTLSTRTTQHAIRIQPAFRTVMRPST
jgi:hypothetical protein